MYGFAYKNRSYTCIEAGRQAGRHRQAGQQQQ
jgi:hypothetical protein